MRHPLIIFISGALFLGLVYAWILLTGKVPLGHDTFQYLQNQYFYYNEIVQHRQLPMWNPYQVHGLPGNYFYLGQLGLLSPLYYLLALFGLNANYLHLFYIQMFVHELFFLAGILALGKIYYSNTKALWITALSLAGSTVWFPQHIWNFHLFFFIPFLLYGLHRALDSGHPRYLLLALAICGLTIVGNPPHTTLFLGFILPVYLLPLLFILRVNIPPLLFNIRPKHIAAIAILLGFMFLSISYLIYGRQEIGYYGSARDAGGTVSLETFLTYGKNTDLNKFGLALNRMPSNEAIDLTLYPGYIVWFFVLVAIFFVREKMSYIILAAAAITAFFSMDSAISRAFYYGFPLGKYFRHIGLTASLCKMFLILYAGFGVAKFFEKDFFARKRWLWLLSLALVPAAGLTHEALTSEKYFWFITAGETRVIALLPWVLGGLTGLSFLTLFLLPARRRRAGFFLCIALLLTADLATYRHTMISARMPAENQEIIRQFAPFRYEFSGKRAINSRQDPTHTRAMLFFPSILKVSEVCKLCSWYDTTEGFLYIDSINAVTRRDYAGKEIGKYLETIGRLPGSLLLAQGYSGLNKSKLAIFANLNVAENETVLRRILEHPQFKPDILLTSPEGLENINNQDLRHLIRPISSEHLTSYYDRLAGRIDIKKFSMNELIVTVRIYSNETTEAFLYYADAWNNHWKAFVNGVHAPLIRANLGYKAVKIPGGTSTVRFTFGSPLHALTMLGGILLMTAVAAAGILLAIDSLNIKKV